jgi:hypothetical protein
MPPRRPSARPLSPGALAVPRPGASPAPQEAAAAVAAAEAAGYAYKPVEEPAAGPIRPEGREIIINDAPAKSRILLTKRPLQEDIQRRTHTVLSTKGRYYPPGMERGEERPLHLSIRPASTAGRVSASGTGGLRGWEG